MRNAILLSQFDVAEVQLIYKSKLPASQRKKITWLQLCQKTHFLQKKVATLVFMEPIRLILRISEGFRMS